MALTEAARRRAMRVLFAGVALGTTSYVISLTVSPLAAQDIGSKTLTGLPWTAGVLGTGLGSLVLSRSMVRRGRRFGLTVGYLVGVIGAAVALVAFVERSLPALIVGTLVFGVGNAANHLGRYAAADLYPPARRGTAVGTVAWAGTIGGVVGPSLLRPAAAFARTIHLHDLAGAFMVTLAGFTIASAAYVLFLRTERPVPTDDVAVVTNPFASPRVQVALVSLASAQLVMVMIMSMTPVHIRDTGHGLGTIGLVLSGHVFGMYGLSPVTGRLADRYGSVRIIIIGFALIASAAILGAAMPEHAGGWLALPLFVLGTGWSCSYVAGSALLTRDLSYAERTKLQGTTDAVVWTSAAASSALSGVILAAAGYVGLCATGAAFVAIPMLIVTARRRAITAVGAPA